MRIGALALVCALCGCASDWKWAKDGATEQDYIRDWNQCVYEAKLATATYGSSAPASRTQSAAVGRGVGDALGAGMAQRDLVKSCMIVKGYTLQQ